MSFSAPGPNHIAIILRATLIVGGKSSEPSATDDLSSAPDVVSLPPSVTVPWQCPDFNTRGSLKNRESSNFIRSKDRKKIFLW